jgi:hypothetical protein
MPMSAFATMCLGFVQVQGRPVFESWREIPSVKWNSEKTELTRVQVQIQFGSVHLGQFINSLCLSFFICKIGKMN